MSSITINLSGPYVTLAGVGGCYHKGPTMFASGSCTFTRNSPTDSNIYFSGSVTSTRPGGSYGFPVTVAVEINGHNLDEDDDNGIPGGRGTCNFSGVVSGETGNLEVVLYCNGGGKHNCTSDVGNFSRTVIGSFNIESVLPFNPEVPPTNISGGSVYNQNNIINGDDKPDWNFYIDWWGESAGTHSITKVNLDLRRSSDPNSAIVAYIDNVQKWTRYNFETLLPKCKVGETYYFFTNVLIDNSYWMGARLIGQIKLFKDGIVWVKRYDNGIKTEATMAYNKYYKDGSRKASRYILVKDYTTGAKHIIDMYTTHYE